MPATCFVATVAPPAAGAAADDVVAAPPALPHAASATPAIRATTTVEPGISNRFMAWTSCHLSWLCSSPATDAGGARFLPTADACSAQARSGASGGAPAAPVPRRTGVDAVAGGGRGPRSGDVRARAGAPTAAPAGRRARLPAAIDAEHVDQPAPGGGSPTRHQRARRGRVPIDAGRATSRPLRPRSTSSTPPSRSCRTSSATPSSPSTSSAYPIPRPRGPWASPKGRSPAACSGGARPRRAAPRSVAPARELEQLRGRRRRRSARTCAHPAAT